MVFSGSIERHSSLFEAPRMSASEAVSPAGGGGICGAFKLQAASSGNTARAGMKRIGGPPLELSHDRSLAMMARGRQLVQLLKSLKMSGTPPSDRRRPGERRFVDRGGLRMRR